MPKPTRSPAAMAKAECSEHRGTQCLVRPSCLVEDGQRCGYFERAVLPLAAAYPESYAKACDAYWRRAGISHPNAAARRCECGNPLPKFKRFCPRCMRERQREQARERKRVERAGLGHANSENGAP